jgi:dCTP deaminase
MILTAARIEEAIERGHITIDPLDPACINPNSVNFHLAPQLLVYEPGELDALKPNPTRLLEIPPEGLLLSPDELYLGCTREVIGSEVYVPLIFGRSSVARLGLFVEITAPLGDLGYLGQWSLQLHAIRPLRIYPNMRIGQVMFMEAAGERGVGYQGAYQGARGPQPSLLHLACRIADAEDEP